VDWIQFLDDHNITWVDRGPNTKHGEVSVKCPLCEDDPSEHLGIALNRNAWACFRDPTHRGVSPKRLIRILLGCSYNEAELIERQYNTPDPEGLEAALAALNGMQKTQPIHEPAAKLLPEFREISPNGLTRRFWLYLKSRGFGDIASLCRRYGLMCCLHGRWQDRIIIPVTEDGELKAWTGRALGNPVHAPRYMANSQAIKQTVFNADATPGQLLFITEGPFDAMKLDYYGQEYGARAVATFGTSLTMDQIQMLRVMSTFYDRTMVLFDGDALGASLVAADWMDTAIGLLPDKVKDPGEMSEEQVKRFVSKLTKTVGQY
jgi:hypothetical protein